MRKTVKIGVMAAFVWWAALSHAESAEQCPPSQGVALQVLGSGGPFPGLNDFLSGMLDKDSGAFRVRVNGTTIVFSGDQNGSDSAFTDFARHASALVMPMPVPQGATGAARRLHAPPGVIGEIARESGVKQLVLSHLMVRSLRNLDRNLAAVRSRYSEPVVVANDLECILLTP